MTDATYDPLRLMGRHAKWVLATGLFAAVVLPGVSTWLSGILVPLILIIMFMGALRLQPSEVSELWQKPGHSLAQILALQLGLPLSVAGVAIFAGIAHWLPLQIVILLMAGPAIMSSPNMAAIMGLSGATAMRLVIWGTALVPVTCLPVLAILGNGLPFIDVLWAAARLAGIIALAGGAGFAVRRLCDRHITQAVIERLDGTSALGLAVFVMALMPALRETAQNDPWALAGWIALAFAINFGPQVFTWSILRGTVSPMTAGSFAIAAGNRNLALFFAALPADYMAAFLPFLAAYQFPMYLTPVLLGAMYRRQPDRHGQ
jgi:ACR3 family arsenite transporter